MTDARPESTPSDVAGERRRFIQVCAAILVLSLALKLPSLFAPRAEDDERIYLLLTTNWLHNGSYSLQGTPILPELPQAIYDKPLFHHPPLTSILLVPFVKARAPGPAILVSWFGHALAVVGVAILCWIWRRPDARAFDLATFLPVLAVALDPILTFCARKIWPDNLVGGFATLGLALTALACQRCELKWPIAAGVAIGCAALAKLTGLLVLPVAVILILTGASRGGRPRCLVAIGISTAVLIGPWFYVFHREYGVFLPDWIKPDAALMALSPHVKRAMSLPWHHYLSQLALIAPVSLLILPLAAAAAQGPQRRLIGLPLLWFITVLAGLLYLRSTGHSMQMRFLTPAIPALYAMLAILLRVSKRPQALAAAALLLTLYGAVHAGFYLQALEFDEIKPVPEILWQMMTASPPTGS